MAYFLVISSDYKQVSCALYQDQNQIAQISDHKYTISKSLIVLLATLLKNHNLTISNLDFIAVNLGPGPFTTLRTVIASVNGICFAIHIPLIGINGLTALLQECVDDHWPVTIALLNAFNKDVYFGIAQDKDIEIGYDNIEILLDVLKNRFPDQQIRFIGSGVELYKQDIQNTFAQRAVITENYPLHASIEQIAKMALKKWQEQKDISYQLRPLYLKEQKFKKVTE